ncbi:toxin-antitoxin system YwqK family antitoxin [Sphingobacterium kitahiroshimense]|uniref:toxin-antitoxin system YwqK family antitoxin n=1 Tax=Sphingobacterium kitahiroshimense TaxID=470446 RepID=UPI003208C82F
MKKFLFILSSLILLLNFAFGQEKAIYYEKLDSNMFRFYFDKNYYLADKSCEFKSIERVATLNPKTQKFDGAFKDFNNNGRLILEGNYINGSKEGTFKAYHPNGILKWEATFKNDMPMGNVIHRYPSDKVAMELLYTDSVILIQDFWLPNGTQKIKDGEGNYSFSIPFEGYNQYGFEFYLAKGKIKDGKQEGNWQILGHDKGGKQTLIALEKYQNGNLLIGEDYFLDNNYRQSKFGIIPYDVFARGEILTFKACNFDDFSNFNMLISKELTNSLIRINAENFTEDSFEYKTKLDKEGNPSKVDFIKKTSSENLNNILEQLIADISFYYPSLENGKPIADILTVTGKMYKNSEGKIIVLPIIIHREKGQ